jgi:hypothetical protein
MAMKINELMIGDWVYNKHHKKNIQIQPYDFFVHGHGNNGTFAVSSTIVSGRDLVPIPLTEEILVKNGWRKESTTIDGDYANWHGEIPICQEDDEFNYERIELTYVHQLQHLLRLAGVQKEIEL